MSSFIENVNRLAKDFVTSYDKRASAKRIIAEINNLIYTESEKPLELSLYLFG